MHRLKLIAAALALTAGLPAMAAALPPLEENPRVVAEFLAAAVGDEIRKNCPDISPRYLRVFQRAQDLESYALGLGYTNDDIETLRKDPANKARLKSMRDAYLAENGVTKGDADSYCRLGYAEIGNGTLTGSLLRAN